MNHTPSTHHESGPTRPEAEAQLLECLLDDSDEAIKAREECIQRTEDVHLFTAPVRKEIYRHIVRWHAEKTAQAIEVFELADRIAKDNVHAPVGMDDILKYANTGQAGSVHQWPVYLGIIWTAYITRSTASQLGTAVDRLKTAQEINAEDLDQVRQAVDRAEERQTRGLKQPTYLKSPGEFADLIFAEWENSSQRHDPGAPMHIHYPVNFRRKEISLIAGQDGVGKSTFAKEVALQVQRHEEFTGRKIVIASLEIPKERVMQEMGVQLIGNKKLNPTKPEEREQIQRTIDYLDEHVLVYDFTGIAQWRDVLDTFGYAARKKDGGIFIFDSLMRAGIGEDDYSQQTIAVTHMAQFCKDHDSHMMLIAHENKSGATRGAKGISDNIDNHFSIEINKAKAERMAELDMEIADMERQSKDGMPISEADIIAKSTEIRTYMKEEWDTRISHKKQRYPGTQQNGARRCWFSKSSYQYRNSPSDSYSVNYLDRWSKQPDQDL